MSRRNRAKRQLAAAKASLKPAKETSLKIPKRKKRRLNDDVINQNDTNNINNKQIKDKVKSSNKTVIGKDDINNINDKAINPNKSVTDNVGIDNINDEQMEHEAIAPNKGVTDQDELKDINDDQIEHGAIASNKGVTDQEEMNDINDEESDHKTMSPNINEHDKQIEHPSISQNEATLLMNNDNQQQDLSIAPNETTLLMNNNDNQQQDLSISPNKTSLFYPESTDSMLQNHAIDDCAKIEKIVKNASFGIDLMNITTPSTITDNQRKLLTAKIVEPHIQRKEQQRVESAARASNARDHKKKGVNDTNGSLMDMGDVNKNKKKNNAKRRSSSYQDKSKEDKEKMKIRTKDLNKQYVQDLLQAKFYTSNDSSNYGDILAEKEVLKKYV